MADVKDRLASALLLAAIAAASPTGCSQRMPADSGELVIAFRGAPVSIDPRLSTDAYGTQILQITHASLIRMDAAGNPLPDLAEGFEARSPTQVVFRLRDGGRFHDGRQLTSADVRATFASILQTTKR